MTSLAARLMPLAITLRGGKRRFSSADRTLAHVARLRRNPVSSTPPSAVTRRADVTSRTVAGWQVYTVAPRGASTRHALYLHGGSYVYEIAPQHWTMIADLADRGGITFTVPILPLAPAETADTMVPKAADLAAALIDEFGAANVSIFGDSAGGGMALAVAQVLRDRGIPSAHATILIAPWLDVSCSDPRLAEIAPRDPWLAVPGSRAAGDLYRGALADADPLVSPIYGSLEGLAPVTVFTGTRDILNADAHRLRTLAVTAGLSLDFHEVEGMIHNYPLLPIPEAGVAREIMVRAVG
ncbi:MAG: alpha/beta hydrolase [Microbacteriaceae bacterium]|nr:alpha/beta hydrolase [Microbacteriaceae bacterium]